MQLKSIRTLGEMTPVLADPNIGKDKNKDNVVYWVFSNVSKTWENLTLISPGDYNGEFPKTFGHYHSSPVTEKYKLISGEGILLMQKRKFIDDDWVSDRLEKIYFVEFLPGEEIEITQEWGHSWTNIGNEPLITMDNWREGHLPEDYKPIEEMGGMGYFFIKKDNRAQFLPNPKYKDLPKPEWVTAKEFNEIENF